MDLPPFHRHAYCWVDEGKDPRFLRSEHVKRQERAAQGREKRKAEEDAADAVNDLKRTNKSLQGKLLLADVQGCGDALEAAAAREEAEHEKKEKKAAHQKLKRTRLIVSSSERFMSKAGGCATLPWVMTMACART